MYSFIKKRVETIENIRTLTQEELYYAYKWAVEEGWLKVSEEVYNELINQVALRGI